MLGERYARAFSDRYNDAPLATSANTYWTDTDGSSVTSKPQRHGKRNTYGRQQQNKGAVYPGAESSEQPPYITSYLSNGLSGQQEHAQPTSTYSLSSHEASAASRDPYARTPYNEPASATSSASSPIYGPPSILLAHITTFGAQGASVDTTKEGIAKKMEDALRYIESCQLYPNGAFFSCAPEELAMVLAHLSTPAGYVSNVTCAAVGKIKRELAAYPQHESLVNPSEMIDVLLDHHCLHPKDSIQVMLRKYMQELVGSSGRSAPPLTAKDTGDIRRPSQQDSRHALTRLPKPSSTAWGDLASQESPTDAWPANAGWQGEKQGHPASAAEDGWTSAALMTAPPPSSSHITKGWLASQSATDAEEVPPSPYTDVPDAEPLKRQNNRQRRVEPTSAPADRRGGRQSSDPRSARPARAEGSDAPPARSRRQSKVVSPPATPAEPVDVHAVRGKLLLRVNVPIPTQADGPNEPRVLAVYENDTPNAAVRDFLFEHHVRDETLQSRLTAHIQRNLAPILQEHRAKQAELLERAEVERKAHIEATLQDIKTKRQSEQTKLRADKEEEKKSGEAASQKSGEAEVISEVSSIDVQLEDGTTPKPMLLSPQKTHLATLEQEMPRPNEKDVAEKTPVSSTEKQEIAVGEEKKEMVQSADKSATTATEKAEEPKVANENAEPTEKALSPQEDE